MNLEKAKTILLVEDEAIIAMAEEMILKRHGYKVISVFSGEQAVETFTGSTEIDLVLMDIDLGAGMDGTQAAELILKHREVPLIFLSAHSEHEVVAKTEGITSYGYVVKNSGKMVLVASIKMAFRLFAARMKEKEKEEALLRERNLLQAVMNGAKNSLLVYLDRDFNFVRVNEAYASSCGYRPEEMIGMNHFDLYPHAENESIFTRVRDTGESFEIHDKPFTFPDQPERGVTWWDWTLHPVKDQAGQVTGLVFSLFETTDRKRMEEALEKACEEKQYLLRELQHRAKNSFTMITSLISLMEISSNSDEAKSALNEIGTRVMAISSLYDLLSVSDDVTMVRLDEYLGRIASSLPGISDNITLQQTCDAITLPIKTAIPLGIIITELITNSIKYAFPAGRCGTVTLSLKKTDAGTAIEVGDDGIGLPEGFDLSSGNTLGLNLVTILAKQINGNFTIEGRNGTRCVLEFPM